MEVDLQRKRNNNIGGSSIYGGKENPKKADNGPLSDPGEHIISKNGGSSVYRGRRCSARIKKLLEKENPKKADNGPLSDPGEHIISKNGGSSVYGGRRCSVRIKKQLEKENPKKADNGPLSDRGEHIVSKNGGSSVYGGRRCSARIQKLLDKENPKKADKGRLSDPEEHNVSKKKKPKLNPRRKEDYVLSDNVIVLSDDDSGSEVVEDENEKINNNVIDLSDDGSGSEVVEDDKERIINNSSVELEAEKKVKETLRGFNKHYLHYIKVEEERCKKSKDQSRKIRKGSKDKKKGDVGGKHSSPRPDLKALTKMINDGATLYPEKRPGNLPGINVGDQFFSRTEMVAIGLHRHWLNEIDYTGTEYQKLEKYKNCEFPLAVSIVVSGQYEDDCDNLDDVVYTGQGGHDLLGSNVQVDDQEMVLGNLALQNNIEKCVPVRLIRRHVSPGSKCRKVYTYDGLYNVVEYKEEKGASGFIILKYHLKRLEGQPPLTTKQVRFGRKSLGDTRGVVCEDISGGQEDIPIIATNTIDNPAVPPTGYMYTKYVKFAKSLKLPADAIGCKCKGSCTNPDTCSCAMLNGLDFPYVSKDGGRLIEAKDVVYECGPSCGCGLGCINKTSQRGLKYQLEVFRTSTKGWAVRSLDFIPSGAPLCEYTGTLMRNDELNNESKNDFIFEIDCLETMEGLDGRERRQGDLSILKSTHVDEVDQKESDCEPEFCIDAGKFGNVARFINHSCEPNLFVQCVLSKHHDIKLARVMLFAADNIPPMQELTYDYGYPLDSVVGEDGKIKQMPCYCGTADCRKRLY